MSLETDHPKKDGNESKPQTQSVDGLNVGKENGVGIQADTSKISEKILDRQPIDSEQPNVVGTNVAGNSNIVGNQNIQVTVQTENKEVAEVIAQAIRDKSRKTTKLQAKTYQGEGYTKGSPRQRRPSKVAPKSGKAKDVDSPVDWFNKLTENQKLYALLVVLLKGLDREVLDNLYILTIENLRREGLSEWLKDARTLGLDDLLNSLLATEENGIVQMLPNYEEEVKHQIGNRYHLLWSIFENLLVNNDKELAFTDWEFRKLIGQAVGRVGIRYPQKLEILIDRLVQNDSHRIVAVGGYILAEVVEVESGKTKLYERILDKWVKSKRPAQFWAAAASIWRIYVPHHESKKIRDVLWKHLETLIDDIDDPDAKTRNEIQALAKEKPWDQVESVLLELFWERVSVISDALDHMFYTEPGDVVPRLIDWLKSDEHGKRAFVSQWAADEILDRISRPEFHTLDAVRWGLKLFPSVLDLAEEDLIDTAFSALRAWFTSDVFDQEKKQKIVRMVVEHIDQASSDQLNIFRNKLAEFCLSSSVEADNTLSALSINLLTRTYFVDGFPVLPENMGNLILLADATPQGKLLDSLGFVSQVHPLISSMVKTYVYLMGYSKMVGSPDKLYHEGNQLVWHDLPRLMSGALIDVFSKSPTSTTWLAALNYGAILDGLDMLTKYPTLDMLNLKFYKSEDEGPLDERPHLSIINYGLQDLSPLDQRVRVADDILSFLIGKIGENDPEVLWKIASQYVKCKPTVDQVSTQVQAAFNKLQEGDISDYREYYAVSCLFMWLVKKDSLSALKICIGWLSEDKDDSLLSIGKYFGKFILRSSLWFDMPIENITELSVSLLRIAPDWTTFELILENVEKQYKKQLQANITELIAPSQLISFLPNSLQSKIVTFLNKWIDDKKSPGDLKNFGERLKFYIEMGLLSTTPYIDESKKFGLVFVDGNLSDQEYLSYALDFISAMEKMPLGENVLPVLYRLGQKVPLAVGYGKHNIPEIGKSFASPNFLNPILMSYPVDKVLFRAILIRNPIFDFDDKKQEWNSVPTVIFDEKRQTKHLDGAKLLYISPYDYRSRNAETIPDAIGDELSRMVKVPS